MRKLYAQTGSTECSHGNKKEADLKESLTELQYRVTQKNGTERAFYNDYWNKKEPGIYVDIVSGEPLFSSLDKFDSGTGWPSFKAPIEKENIVTVPDRNIGMVRTEVRSKNADSHLGHVFEDGPAPTGLRYCINSAALRFVPKDKMNEEGYGEFNYLFDESDLQTQLATFAGGCFWGVEEAFRQIPGVLETAVGYSGGHTREPGYKQVCSGTSGHAEVVQVRFDPSVISYRKLLEVFFEIHDPTQLNRQGPDIGAQYRSEVFFHTPDQEQKAKSYVQELTETNHFENPIVTKITPAAEFYMAEEYHQRYLEKQGKASCG